jgi:hypothetical protein
MESSQSSRTFRSTAPQNSEPGRKESQQFQNVVPDIFGLEASDWTWTPALQKSL